MRLLPKLSLISVNVLLCASMTGCHAGNSSSSTDTQNSVVAANNTTPSVALNDVEIGWGYDTDTNSIIPLNTDPSRLVGVQPEIPTSEPQSVILSTSAKYKDYANYSHDAGNSSSVDKDSMKANLGVSYGLFKASMKAALERSENQEDSSVSIKKSVGFVNETTSYLTIDAANGNKVTPLNASRVADAIVTANPEIKVYIEKIRNAKTEALRNKAILNFYTAFGTQFISSVTRGYVGFSEVNLSQNTSSGSSSTAFSSEASFSAPFVSGGASYSFAKASQYNKSNWDISYSSTVLPYNTELKSAVDTLEKKISDILKDQKDGVYDFTAFSDSEKIRSNIEFPTVDTTSYEPSAELIDKKKAQTLLLKKVAYDLSELEGSLAELQITVTDRDKESNTATQKQEFQKLIEAEVTPTSTIGTLLAKFTPIGDYSDITLSPAQAARLKVAKDSFDVIKNNLQAKSKDINEKIDDINKKAEAEKKLEEKRLANKDKTDFTGYLKQVHQRLLAEDAKAMKKAEEAKAKAEEDKKKDIVVEAKIDPVFKVWYDNLSLTQVKGYKEEFQAYLEKEGLIDAPTGSAIQLTEEKILLRKQSVETNSQASNFKAASLISVQKASDAPVVLNYNIMPWSTIFPELTTQMSNGPLDLIKAKLMKRVDVFMLDRSYLALASRFNAGPNLSNAYNEDKKTVVVQLNDILKKMEDSYNDGVDANRFTYGTTDYDYTEDAEKIEAIIDGIIQQSSMAKLNNGAWYKEVTRLREAGLLNPQGDVLTTTARSNNEELAIRHTNPKAIATDLTKADYSSLFLTFSQYTTTQKNIGQLLGRIYMHGESQSQVTVLPIVHSYSAGSGKDIGIGVLASDDTTGVPGSCLMTGCSFGFKMNGDKVEFANPQGKAFLSVVKQQSSSMMGVDYPSNLTMMTAEAYYYGGQYYFIPEDSSTKTYIYSINQDTLAQMRTEMTEKFAKEISPKFRIFYGSDAQTGSVDYINTMLGIY